MILEPGMTVRFVETFTEQHWPILSDHDIDREPRIIPRGERAEVIRVRAPTVWVRRPFDPFHYAVPISAIEPLAPGA